MIVRTLPAALLLLASAASAQHKAVERPVVPSFGVIGAALPGFHMTPAPLAVMAALPAIPLPTLGVLPAAAPGLEAGALHAFGDLSAVESGPDALAGRAATAMDGSLDRESAGAAEFPEPAGAVPVSEPAKAPGWFEAALTGLTAYPHRVPSGDEREALRALAGAARNAEDVVFLTRLALLTGHDSRTQHLMTSALEEIRDGSILEPKGDEARKALGTIQRHQFEALPSHARKWMADRLRENVGSYIP